MKLRQKLAMVLATAMVVTAVPVVTFAASTNETTNIVKVTDGTALKGNTAPDLKIKLKDGITTTSPIYITLENATWENVNDETGATYYEYSAVARGTAVGQAPAEAVVGKIKNGSNVIGEFHVIEIGKKEMAIEYVSTAANAAADADAADAEAITETKDYVLQLPMLATVTGGEAKVHIAGTKWVTGTGENAITIATTKEGTASIIEPKDVPSFYTEGGKVAPIVLQEDTINALKATAEGGFVTLTLDFDADDFELDATQQTPAAENITVKLSRGFRTETLNPAFTSDKVDNTVTATETAATVKVYKDSIEIKMPVSFVSGSDIGRIEVSNVRMKSTDRTPTLGEITLSVDNDAFDNKDVVVANVAEYGVTLKNATKDEKAVEMLAGRKSEVKFTLKETVDATLTGGRDLEFTLDQGFFTKTTDIKVKHKANNSTTNLTPAAITDNDGNITGFTVKPASGLILDGQLDSIEVVADVVLPMSKEGDVTVKVAGRTLGEEKELVVATAKPIIKVESDTFAINSGEKTQVGGKLVITETDKGMLEKGDLTFTLPVEDGIEFTAKPTVEVTTGDLKIADKKDINLTDVYDVKVLTWEHLGLENENQLAPSETKYKVVSMDSKELKEYSKNKEVIDKELTGVKVVVPVTRSSKEASTITVTDFEVKLGRSVPTGAYDLKVAGSAVGTKGNFNQEGFFQVGIKNEDAGTEIVTTIAKDATEMVVNGEKVALPSPAYINGTKLMAPLRAVANAFGFEDSAINYNSATKEILVRGNGSVVKLTIGSKEAFLNGTPMTLAVPAEIKAEATYVPVGDLGRLLGLTVEWDGTTKTATFKN